MADFLPSLDFHGRAVFVTGAGAGIGRATALAFARLGAAVAVTDIDEAAAAAVADEIGRAGGAAFAFALDVADEAAVDAAVAGALARFKAIDVLVNNAGIGARVATVDMPTERWRRVLDVGLTGAFHCARAVGRPMVERRQGAVVNVASIMGLTGGGLYPNPAYHAVKGALVNLTRALALEWAPFGVRVNAVAPAFVRTRLVEPLMADPVMAKALIDATPLGRLVEPEEVADAIVFLASDAAAMITGHTLPVDGGWLAR
ncbi:MAG TPA: SDR family NAD(P)-dependent oxidoreductase [Beijerinckiaceae bacterium]|jgi:NAD(P)-dependent dehydrogenase (short-subunit alcohol dehydrogenase family)